MINRSSNCLGVDVGGTITRVGAVDANGRLLIADRFQTPRSAEPLLDRIITAVETLSWSCSGDGVEPDAIGVALPGPIDRDHAGLLRSVNLPFLQRLPISRLIEQRTGLRASLHTDAEAATWGEFSVCHPSHARFVHLRFGTGIACGIVVDGELQRTSTDRQTHLPELVVDNRPNAAECACGLRGCLELFASGPAIERRADQLPLPENLAKLQESHHAGDTRVRAFVGDIAERVVQAIRNVVDPLPHGRGSERGKETTIVCLGGGVLQALPALFESVCELCRAPDAVPGGRIEVPLTRLGDDAGVIGAALLAATT